MPDYTQHDLDAAREWHEKAAPWEWSEDGVKSLAALLARHREKAAETAREECAMEVENFGWRPFEFCIVDQHSKPGIDMATFGAQVDALAAAIRSGGKGA